jgi:hypothetical protein
MYGKFIGGIAVLVLLIGGPISVENYAGARQNDTVRDAVASLVPDAHITRVDPRGRPYILALATGGNVSSADVDIDTGAGSSTLIVQNLNHDKGTMGSLLWFTKVPQAVPLIPVVTSDGEQTAVGTTELGGKQVTVTYVAAVTGHTLCVRPKSIAAKGQPAKTIPAEWEAKLSPEPIPLPAFSDVSVTDVSVSDGGVEVALRATDVDPAHDARTGSEAAAGACDAG